MDDLSLLGYRIHVEYNPRNLAQVRSISWRIKSCHNFSSALIWWCRTCRSRSFHLYWIDTGHLWSSRCQPGPIWVSRFAHRSSFHYRRRYLYRRCGTELRQRIGRWIYLTDGRPASNHSRLVCRDRWVLYSFLHSWRKPWQAFTASVSLSTILISGYRDSNAAFAFYDWCLRNPYPLRLRFLDHLSVSSLAHKYYWT